jgi:transcriptional regulator with XRE-family HTH domain
VYGRVFLNKKINELGLRRDYLSNLLGISKSYLSQLLSGYKEFPDILLKQLNYIISTYDEVLKENKIA